jgi:LacI family transcriptional regulator
MRVTLKQIAAKSGFSVMAVSYVLNNKAHLVRPETRDTILKAARELGYLPNTSARALRTGRFNCYTLLLSSTLEYSHLPRELLSGIIRQLAERNLHLNLLEFPDEKLGNSEVIPDILRQYMSDGLLINYHYRFPTTMQKLVKQYKIPSVWINVQNPTDAVVPDELTSARALTKELLNQGHRRIAFFDASGMYNRPAEENHFSVAVRREGYLQAMKAAGLEPILHCGNISADEQDAFGRELLGRPDRPTALIAYSNEHLLPAYLSAAALGMRVPQDLSLASFGDRTSTLGRLSVTMMVSPWAEVGMAAVKMLAEKVEHPRKRFDAVVIPSKYCVGQTTSGH